MITRAIFGRVISVERLCWKLSRSSFILGLSTGNNNFLFFDIVSLYLHPSHWNASWRATGIHPWRHIFSAVVQKNNPPNKYYLIWGRRKKKNLLFQGSSPKQKFGEMYYFSTYVCLYVYIIHYFMYNHLPGHLYSPWLLTLQLIARKPPLFFSEWLKGQPGRLQSMKKFVIEKKNTKIAFAIIFHSEIQNITKLCSQGQF